MPLIHADGLFDGDRINSCSIQAQLYYPRLMCASNGFGRINLSYAQIVAHAFPRWPAESIPEESELLGYVQEYVDNRLLYGYRSGGQLWGQWDAIKGTFGKYQTSDDKRSPAPPEPEFSQWLEENRKNSSRISEPCGKIAEKVREGSEIFPHGVGVGVGIGDGVTCKVLREDSCAEPSSTPAVEPFIKLPLNDGSVHPVNHQAIAGWKELYPAVEIEQQLRNMLGWLSSHRARLKTKQGIGKFINSWLAREQDRGGNVQHQRNSETAGSGARPQSKPGTGPGALHTPGTDYSKYNRKPAAIVS